MRHRSSFVLSAAILATLVAAPAAPDAARPAVEVCFTLAQPDYRDEFSEADIALIQERAAELMASFLTEQIGYIDFGGGAESSYVLQVALDSQEPGSRGELAAVGLHFELSGPGVDDSGHSYWVLRPEERAGEPIPRLEPLLAELALLLDSGAANTPALVRDVLSAVKIAEECDVLDGEPAGWVLPFTLDELCIDLGTRLHIRHEVLQNIITQQLSFHVEARGAITAQGHPGFGRVFCALAAGEDPDQLSQLQGGSVRTTAIYVVSYDRPTGGCAAGGPTPPSELFAEVEP